jgi:hypothetical protein
MKLDIKSYEAYLTQRNHLLILWEKCGLPKPLKFPAHKPARRPRWPKAA